MVVCLKNLLLLCVLSLTRIDAKRNAKRPEICNDDVVGGRQAVICTDREVQLSVGIQQRFLHQRHLAMTKVWDKSFDRWRIPSGEWGLESQGC